MIPVRCRTLTWKLLNSCIFLLSCLAIFAILVARGHYLIDILLAYYVTTRVFYIYHSLAHNQSLRVASPTNYLSRVWWWYLFKYFECIPDDHHSSCEPVASSPGKRSGHHSPGCSYCDSLPKIPQCFEWPLPWPRWLRRRSNRYRQRLLPTPAA